MSLIMAVALFSQGEIKLMWPFKKKNQEPVVKLTPVHEPFKVIRKKVTKNHPGKLRSVKLSIQTDVKNFTVSFHEELVDSEITIDLGEGSKAYYGSYPSREYEYNETCVVKGNQQHVKARSAGALPKYRDQWGHEVDDLEYYDQILSHYLSLPGIDRAVTLPDSDDNKNKVASINAKDIKTVRVVRYSETEVQVQYDTTEKLENKNG